jgi:hypothetical protein
MRLRRHCRKIGFVPSRASAVQIAVAGPLGDSSEIGFVPSVGGRRRIGFVSSAQFALQIAAAGPVGDSPEIGFLRKYNLDLVESRAYGKQKRSLADARGSVPRRDREGALPLAQSLRLVICGIFIPVGEQSAAHRCFVSLVLRHGAPRRIGFVSSGTVLSDSRHLAVLGNCPDFSEASDL